MSVMKGRFDGCKWCYGKGCLCCAAERKKAEERAMEPIFTARLDDPEDMERAKKVIGFDALQKAFGPNGGGVREVEYNAAVQSQSTVTNATEVSDER